MLPQEQHEHNFTALSASNLTEQLGLEGASGNHLVQPPAKADSPRAGLSRIVGLSISRE